MFYKSQSFHLCMYSDPWFCIVSKWRVCVVFLSENLPEKPKRLCVRFYRMLHYILDGVSQNFACQLTYFLPLSFASLLFSDLYIGLWECVRFLCIFFLFSYNINLSVKLPFPIPSSACFILRNARAQKTCA